MHGFSLITWTMKTGCVWSNTMVISTIHHMTIRRGETVGAGARMIELWWLLTGGCEVTVTTAIPITRCNICMGEKRQLQQVWEGKLLFLHCYQVERAPTKLDTGQSESAIAYLYIVLLHWGGGSGFNKSALSLLSDTVSAILSPERFSIASATTVKQTSTSWPPPPQIYMSYIVVIFDESHHHWYLQSHSNTARKTTVYLLCVECSQSSAYWQHISWNRVDR